LQAVTRGQELAARDRHEEALGAFREALARNPKSTGVQMRVAETLLALGRYEEAFAGFAEVIASGSPAETAYVGMSRARLGQGRQDDALAVTLTGLRAIPQSVALNTQHGQFLLQRQQPAQAEQAFRRALAATPQDEAAQWGLGSALARQGRRRESAEVMLQLAERSPRSRQGRATAEALELWADERLDAGATEEARRVYDAVLSTGRVSAALFLNLALATWRSGHQPDAVDVLERGLSRFPDSTELLYRKGRILQQAGRLAEAKALYTRVLELDRNHAAAAAALRRP
jgi:tetratricopeptide (TPR) repeat protein